MEKRELDLLKLKLTNLTDVEKDFLQIYFEHYKEITVIDTWKDSNMSTALQDNAQNLNFNDTFIYNDHAMKFLLENDMSLQLSVDIAYEHGFELKNINSALLANLLYADQMRDLDIINDIILYYDNLMNFNYRNINENYSLISNSQDIKELLKKEGIPNFNNWKNLFILVDNVEIINIIACEDLLATEDSFYYILK